MSVLLYNRLRVPGDIIAQRRTELQVSQTELSKKLGYRNPNFISMIEKGTSRTPIDRAVEFARALEMDPCWFLEMVLRDHYPNTAEFLFSEETLKTLLARK